MALLFGCVGGLLVCLCFDFVIDWLLCLFVRYLGFLLCVELCWFCVVVNVVFVSFGRLGLGGHWLLQAAI